METSSFSDYWQGDLWYFHTLLLQTTNLAQHKKTKVKQNPDKCNFLYNVDSILLLPSISILFYVYYYLCTMINQ